MTATDELRRKLLKAWAVVFIARVCVLVRRIRKARTLSDNGTSTPGWAVPPGGYLRGVLEERGITRNELSQMAGIAPETITLIVDAVVPVDMEIAQRLYKALGVPPDFWLRTEAEYRDHLTRQQRSPAEE